MVPKQLTPEQQRARFAERGITFPRDTKVRDANKIQEIGYYKLKEFAYPFFDTESETYKNLSFKALLNRYYQDKNFRIFMLHAIEDVEVRLNNAVASQLGQKYGAFGYLEFNNWVNREIPKFQVEKNQYFFKSNLLKKIKRSNLRDLRQRQNLNNDGFPTVWTMVDSLTFGDTVHLVEAMAPANLKRLANSFACSPTELVSWIKCMNFIRNVCVHNSDLIDIRLITKPLPPSEYRTCILPVQGGYANGVAIAVLILKHLMNHVNSRYKFVNIEDSLKKIIGDDDGIAHMLGFANKAAISVLIKREYYDTEEVCD